MKNSILPFGFGLALLFGCGGPSDEPSPSSASQVESSNLPPLEKANALLNGRHLGKAKAFIEEALPASSKDWQWDLVQERLKSMQSDSKLDLQQLPKMLSKAKSSGQVSEAISQLSNVLGQEFKWDVLNQAQFQGKDIQWYQDLYQQAKQLNLGEAKKEILGQLSGLIIEEGDKLLDPKVLQQAASLLNIDMSEMNLHYVIEANKFLNSGAVQTAKQALKEVGFDAKSLGTFLASIELPFSFRGKGGAGPKMDPGTVEEGKASIKALMESL